MVFTVKLPTGYCYSMKIDNILSFAAQCIRFRSVSPGEGEIGTFLCQDFLTRGWKVQRMEVSKNRFNILVSFGVPKILFTTHMDVVDAPDHLFQPRIDNGTLWGRGACDTKGILATMVAVAEILTSRMISDFGLLFVVGEEREGDGA